MRCRRCSDLIWFSSPSKYLTRFSKCSICGVRQGSALYALGPTPTKSEVVRLREENEKLRESIRNLIDDKARVHKENTQLQEEVLLLRGEVEKQRAENADLLEENRRLKEQMEALHKRIAELERAMMEVENFFDDRELGTKIEFVILEHITTHGEVGLKFSYLDHLTSVLKDGSNRRHTLVLNAIKKLESTDPWVADISDYKIVLQNCKQPASDYGHKGRPKDFAAAFSSIVATIRKLDITTYPTKDAFVDWLEMHRGKIQQT